MSRFVDLDAVSRPDLDVLLGGQTYRVPGTVSTPRMLRWMQFELRVEEAAKAANEKEIVAVVGEMYEDLLDLFRIHQPDLEELEIDRDQTQKLFGALNEQYADEGDAPDPTSTPRPRPRPRSGKRSGSSRTPASGS